MAFEISDYIPHVMIAAFASVTAWVFRDHVERDDERFKDFSGSVAALSNKLDEAFKTQAAGHAEILKILLEMRT